MKRKFWDLTLAETILIIVLAVVFTYITLPNVTMLKPDRSAVGPQ
jgi:hypothetical protein